MNKMRLHELAELCSEGVSWGSEFTPQLLDEIVTPLQAEIRRLYALLENNSFITAYMEWSEKTNFIQEWSNQGKLPAKYLGWHRADIIRDLLENQQPAARQVPDDADALQRIENNVCARIPEGFIVRICFDNDAAWCELSYQDDYPVKLPNSADKTVYERLQGAINAALLHASETVAPGRALCFANHRKYWQERISFGNPHDGYVCMRCGERWEK